MTVNFKLDGVVIPYSLYDDSHDIYMSFDERASGSIQYRDNSYIFNMLFDGKHNTIGTNQPLTHYWASSIVGYEIRNGDWPQTNTVEDCIKLCDELQRVLAMAQSDRDDYINKLKHNHLMVKMLKEF